MTQSSSPDRLRIGAVIGITFAVAIGVALLPAVPQDPSYHLFADRVAALGIPNFLNVVSNLPLLLAGIWGLISFLKGQVPLTEKKERLPYLVFFASVALTGPGSAWYHLNPANETLVWDRLPMAAAFMALLAAMINERIKRGTGNAMLLPLVLFGISSVVYWYLGEQRGTGDLRPYAFVQYYPMAAILLLICLFPPRYSRTGDLFSVMGWYLLAKVAEVLDASLYGLTGGLSGHTLKHLFAAMAVFWIVRMLRKREQVSAAVI